MRLTLSLITASAYFLSAAAAPTPIGACNSYIDLLTGNCDLTGPNEAITPRSVGASRSVPMIPRTLS